MRLLGSATILIRSQQHIPPRRYQRKHATGIAAHQARSFGGHLDTTIVAGIAIGLSLGAILLSAWTLLARRSRSKADARLLQRILANQATTSPAPAATTSPAPPPPVRRAGGSVPPTSRRASPDTHLAALERHLRTAILSPDARERLVKDVMRSTGRDRAAAIRRVLDDLHAEDKRWS
ncbi:MAG TPA: hypothetical protein VMB34_26665 [Acetobacteraceae bacterium]|nr:hypothetical protein [Acetobacteraceae bacterium]